MGGKGRCVCNRLLELIAQAQENEDKNMDWGNTGKLGTDSLPLTSRHCAVLEMQHVSKRQVM